MWGDSIRSMRIAPMLLHLWVTYQYRAGRERYGRYPTTVAVRRLVPYCSHNGIGSFSAAPNDLDAQIKML